MAKKSALSKIKDAVTGKKPDATAPNIAAPSQPDTQLEGKAKFVIGIQPKGGKAKEPNIHLAKLAERLAAKGIKLTHEREFHTNLTLTKESPTSTQHLTIQINGDVSEHDVDAVLEKAAKELA